MISNAVLFSGKWSEVFKLDQTRSGQWNGADGVRDVPMMSDLRSIPYYTQVSCINLPEGFLNFYTEN